jgi:hypothetical protein
MKTKIITSLALLSSLIACKPSADNETQQSLKAYTIFVDSVYAQNEVWKMYPDTDFVETPYDVNDPSKTRIDTIVTAADKKEKSIMLNAFFGKIILEKYEKVKATAESKTDKMDEKMKKEFEESKQKFESLLIP